MVYENTSRYIITLSHYRRPDAARFAIIYSLRVGNIYTCKVRLGSVFCMAVNAFRQLILYRLPILLCRHKMEERSPYILTRSSSKSGPQAVQGGCGMGDLDQVKKLVQQLLHDPGRRSQ
jgi:hypothetical protein